jgi:hypothetical protein
MTYGLIELKSLTEPTYTKKMLKMKVDPTMCMKTKARLKKWMKIHRAFRQKMHGLGDKSRQASRLFAEKSHVARHSRRNQKAAEGKTMSHSRLPAYQERQEADGKDNGLLQRERHTLPLRHGQP